MDSKLYPLSGILQYVMYFQFKVKVSEINNLKMMGSFLRLEKFDNFMVQDIFRPLSSSNDEIRILSKLHLK